MSRRAQTTLILGAGASVPYGFPTGRSLADQIIEELTQGSTPLHIQLHKCGFEHEAIREFATRLTSLELYSIDRFLEAQPSYREIGGAAIAAIMIPNESSDRLKASDEDHWYRHLFNELLSGQTYDSSWLHVLTFNYDRSLEQYLFERLVDGMG